MSDTYSEAGVIAFRYDKNYLSVLLIKQEDELQFPSVKISQENEIVQEELVKQFKTFVDLDVLVISENPVARSDSRDCIYYGVIVDPAQELDIEQEDITGLWYHKRYVQRYFKNTDFGAIYQQALRWVERDDFVVEFLAKNLAKLQ